jgi:hypothetical protein
VFLGLPIHLKINSWLVARADPIHRKSRQSQLIMSAQEVADAFVNHYYTTFDTNPSALAGLYVSKSSAEMGSIVWSCTPRAYYVCCVQQPQSSVTFEGKALVGPQQIIEKYVVRMV